MTNFRHKVSQGRLHLHSLMIRDLFIKSKKNPCNLSFSVGKLIIEKPKRWMAEMQKEMSKSWEFLSSGPYLIFVAHAKNFKVRGNFSIFNAKGTPVESCYFTHNKWFYKQWVFFHPVLISHTMCNFTHSV